MIEYRVEIEVPGADMRELDAVRHALAELEMPTVGQAIIKRPSVIERHGSAVVTAEIEARTPVTAMSTVYAIVAGAASQWRMDRAAIGVAPARSHVTT